MRHAGCLTRRQMTSVAYQNVEESVVRVGQTFLSAKMQDHIGIFLLGARASCPHQRSLLHVIVSAPIPPPMMPTARPIAAHFSLSLLIPSP